MVANLRDLHFMSNVVTAATGRTLIATTMMASMLKNDDNRITVQIKGNGEVGNIVVCGDNSLQMKAYATNPQVDIPKKENGKLDVSGIVGEGYLNIVKDIGLKDPYVGVCKLQTSEIAEDFAYYLATSEQTPCVVSLGVNISQGNKVQKACGYIIEPLPDCSEDVIDLLEAINSQIASVSNLMLDIGDIDEVAKTISGDNDIKCIEEKEPVLKCDCSIKRIEKTIIALGQDDVNEILNENNGKIELCCDFCNTKYVLDKNDVDKLFKEV